jgi:hypothetical protein
MVQPTLLGIFEVQWKRSRQLECRSVRLGSRSRYLEMDIRMSNSCAQCPVQASVLAAAPAIVRLDLDGKTWMMLPEGTSVHLIALFRDPGISDNRAVPVVLDLWLRGDGSLAAGRNCWVEPFLKALDGLPSGLMVALDNGARCPYHRQVGSYGDRARLCVGQTHQWIGSFAHPDGGKPGLLICDKDLACAYAELNLLVRPSGTAWKTPRRFVEAVGDEVVFQYGTAVYEAMILAHPALFNRRHASIYADAFRQRQIVSKIKKLARV